MFFYHYHHVIINWISIGKTLLMKVFQEVLCKRCWQPLDLWTTTFGPVDNNLWTCERQPLDFSTMPFHPLAHILVQSVFSNRFGCIFSLHTIRFRMALSAIAHRKNPNRESATWVQNGRWRACKNNVRKHGKKDHHTRKAKNNFVVYSFCSNFASDSFTIGTWIPIRYRLIIVHFESHSVVIVAVCGISQLPS